MIIQAAIKCANCGKVFWIDVDPANGDEQVIETICPNCYHNLTISRVVEYIVKLEVEE